jgi:selenocysteine-specific elongation factor
MAGPLKKFILGTAGHIDHGKTRLVKAISGYDTDRLKEEKLRGITIELGFAALDLPSGIHLGIVDVPGHEKFVKHMVAGATGIDVVAMIIAADEGVMPQTREHLDICTLLGVRHGIIVLTKIDAVDEEWRELVIDDIRKFVSGTFLENAPLLPVSSLTGEGIPELIQALDALCIQLSEKQPSGLFRLPADRVFTIKGFGTVITGTLISGRIAVGESVMIYPSGIVTKVRGLQVHDQTVEEASAGMRTAINFQGIEKASVNRGDVVARPDTLKTSYMLDVELTLLKSVDKPMKNRTRARFHTGTAEIPCHMIFLDRESLDPGLTAVAQIRLDTPLACVRDDRFVIRSYSPVQTLGGGRVINPVPQKHKRFKPEITRHLHTLSTGDPEALITEYAKQAAFDEISYADLCVMTNLSGKILDNALQSLMSKHILIQTDKEARRYIHRETYDAFKSITISRLKEFHKINPLKNGMPKGELPSSFPASISGKLFNLMLTMAATAHEVIVSENVIRLPDHQVILEADQSVLRKKFGRVYAEAGLQPPTLKELINKLGVDAKDAKNMLMLLVNEGALIKVKEDLFFDAKAIIQLKEQLIDYLKSNGEINTPQFKDITGVSRKYTIPLLEYFDAENLTIRIGDIRRLRKQD